MSGRGGDAPAEVCWWDDDPERRARDEREVRESFGSLAWVAFGAGGWDGRLPVWPFARPEPSQLRRLVPQGLVVELRYLQAYPMVPPSIRPTSPEPSVEKWTVHRWHVNGDGSLCLLQSSALWDPGASVTDLLLKAAGWNVEYALMQAGAVDSMTVNGIVSDDSLDRMITDTALSVAAPS